MLEIVDFITGRRPRFSISVNKVRDHTKNSTKENLLLGDSRSFLGKGKDFQTHVSKNPKKVIKISQTKRKRNLEKEKEKVTSLINKYNIDIHIAPTQIKRVKFKGRIKEGVLARQDYYNGSPLSQENAHLYVPQMKKLLEACKKMKANEEQAIDFFGEKGFYGYREFQGFTGEIKGSLILENILTNKSDNNLYLIDLETRKGYSGYLEHDITITILEQLIEYGETRLSLEK